jgi:hypothetical protein
MGAITPEAVATVATTVYENPAAIDSTDTKFKVTVTAPATKGVSNFIYKYVLNAIDNKNSWR